METRTKSPAKNINKPAYVIFLVAGTYFLFRENLSQAASFWGIALIFDPFNIDMPFSKRPFYQKAWLFVHLAITFVLFGFMVMR